MKRTVFYLLLWSILVLVVDSLIESAPECTVCEDGSAVPKDKRKQPLHLESIDVKHCRQLERVVGFFPPDSETCDLVRTLGPLCGCSLNLTIGTNRGCQLCMGAQMTNLTNATYVLPGLSGIDLIPHIPASSQISQVSCEVLQSVLLASQNPNSSTCHRFQSIYAKECGCPTHNQTMDDELVVVVDPNLTLPAHTCSLCWDGSPIPYPDLEIPYIPDKFPSTCGRLDSLMRILSVEDPWCQEARGVSLYCGCPSPPPQSACSFCPNGETVPRPSRELDWLEKWTWLQDLFADGETVNCVHMEFAMLSLEKGEQFGQSNEADLLCLSAQLRSWICGCSPDWRQILLTWAYRTSGILSLLGSLSIIVSVLRKKRNRFSTYHQLILSICVFDCISSFFYTMVGVMAPVEDGFYLSRGNYDTCKAQAFMIQLGHQTSMFYNMCLSLYFLLVISYNWKEYQFQKYMPYIHGTVIILGLGLAFGALPFYGPQLGVCGILQPPARTVTWWPVSLLFTLPLSIVLLTLACSTAMVCHKVYRQQKKAMRWSLRSNVTNNLSKRVFWQSFWYMMAFYVTVPFLLLSYYFRFRSSNLFWILIVSAVLGPSQGVMNTFVYFQRLASNSTKNKERESRQEQSRRFFRRTSLVFRRMGVLAKRSALVTDDSTKGGLLRFTSFSFRRNHKLHIEAIMTDDWSKASGIPKEQAVANHSEEDAKLEHDVVSSSVAKASNKKTGPNKSVVEGESGGLRQTQDSVPLPPEAAHEHVVSSSDDWGSDSATPSAQGSKSSHQEEENGEGTQPRRRSSIKDILPSWLVGPVNSQSRRGSSRSAHLPDDTLGSMTAINNDPSGVLEHWLLNIDSGSEDNSSDVMDEEGQETTDNKDKVDADDETPASI